MFRLGLRQRLWLLLIGLTGSLLLAAGFIVSRYTLDPGADQLANLVFATATAIDAAPVSSASAQASRAALQRVGVLLRDAAPPDELPLAPVGVVVLAKLRVLRPEIAAVRFENGPPTRLWVRSRTPPQRWIGIPVQPLGKRIARASLWILAISGIAVLISGAWFARSLSRPLEQLAARAPNLMAGDLDLHEFRTAPAEVRTLAETLSQASDQLRIRHERREQMLVGLSHDLRTPLARLRFAIEMGDHNEPTARASMQNDIEEMDALIGAFLMLQREGREEIENEWDIAALLREIVQGFATRAAVGLLGDGQPLLIRGRRLAVRRAVSNLLQNAFDHGSEPISVELARDADRVHISVHDAGRRHDLLHQRTGYGLGLGVVRTLAAMHGGGAQFEFGEHGSCASLWLPISARPESARRG